MTTDFTGPRSRRALLGAAIGSAAAFLASTLGRPAPAAADDGDPLLLGKGAMPGENVSGGPTIIDATQVGLYVRCVVATAGMFTIVLSKACAAGCSAAYFVID